MAIITPCQDKSTPLSKKVFPLQKERGEKRLWFSVCKELQAECRISGMSLRSLKSGPVSKTPALASTGTPALALLDLNGGNFSLNQALTGVYT